MPAYAHLYRFAHNFSKYCQRCSKSIKTTDTFRLDKGKTHGEHISISALKKYTVSCRQKTNMDVSLEEIW